jgi:hypothetical protein
MLLLAPAMVAAATTELPDAAIAPSVNALHAPSALLVIDQHRASVIERIVSEWGAPLEQSNAGISSVQLRAMLEGLRADHLLAASLAGSLSGLRDVLAAAVSGAAPHRPAKTIQALGDANRDLVYTPVTPCRLFDTRPLQGGIGPPALNLRRTYGAITPVPNQGGPGGCAAGAGAAVALIVVGTIAPSGIGYLQGGPQGAASFPNALILYQPGDQYGTTVAMPLNPANGQFDLVEQIGTTDLYGDLLGYFRAPAGAAGPDAYVSNLGGGIDSTELDTALTSLAVPAGSYVVTAKLYGISAAQAGDYSILCSLMADGTTQLDFTHLTNLAGTYSNLSLQGSFTFVAPGTLALTCSATGPVSPVAYRIFGVSLAATKVGTLH